MTSIDTGAFQGCPLECITLPFVGGSKTSTGSSAVFGYIFGYESVRIGTTSSYVNGHVDKSFGSQPASTVWQYSEYVYSSTSSYGTRYYYPTSYYYYIPSTLTTVVIADATVISEEAFYNCVNITNVTLNNGIETIGANAFKNCSVLRSMSLPTSVTEVGSYGFYGCVNMASVTMSNLTKINSYMFYNCSSLTSITLPTTLTEIGSNAFKGCCLLDGIVIPNTVTSIGNYAFSGCTGITEISLPAELKSIGNYVFENVQLTTIVVPNTVESIGEGAFKGCSALHIVELPESIISVGDSAFASCSNLRIVRIYNGDVTQLTTLGGNKVFDGSTVKNLIIIVPMDTYQAYKTASYWSGYSSRIYSDEYIVNNNSLIVDGTLLQYWGDEKSYTMPDSVKIIGSYAFYGSSIEELKYGASLEQIKNDAFANCTNLAKINSTENGVFNLNGTLKKIGARAFYNNANATKIIVNSSVETIEYAAFMGCTNLVSVELPFIRTDRNSTYSQSQVFGYIFGYETSNKEGTTMQYTNYYYYIPASLREVVITDESVISKNAFINCSMLESIIIKSDLTTIGDYAFYNCNGLKTITIESNTMPTISAYVFNGDSNVVIKVNSAILSDYQSDANWSKRTLEAIQ